MAVQLSNISCAFGSTLALQNIDFKVAHGEQIALIGPSGCGKTTLLRLLGTQIPASSGGYRLLGENPQKLGSKQLKKLRTQIASIPQHLGLVSNARVDRNILNGGLGKINMAQTLRQALWPKSSDSQGAFDWLERTGIGEKFYDRTDSLSGGQQQRVAVARALYQNPSILLADEPISAIDPARARDMIQLLTRLSQEEGITLIVSLHNLDLAREFFPRLIGLRQGKVAFDKSPEELSDSDCHQLYELNSAIATTNHGSTS